MFSLKKGTSLLLLVCMIGSTNFSVFAGEKADQRINSAKITATNICENFEPMSKSDYIKTKAQAEGITYNEADEEINTLIARDLKKYGVPDSDEVIGTRAIQHNYTEYQGNGLYYIYGYVYFIDPIDSDDKLQVRSQVPVIISSHHYGRNFADVGKSDATAYAYGNGRWTLEDSSTTVYVNSKNTEVKIQYTGIITIKKSIAASLGINVEKFFAGGSIGTDGYCRKFVSNLNKELLQSSN